MLDFFKEIFYSFKQNSVERVRSPFLGAFVFSWLGFNWPTLAIILFSKKDIIDRIKEVNSNYDVGHFILAPCLTTIAICIILPSANKLFTKLQSKPNLETAETIYNDKIEVAQYLLEIATLDAKRETAKERERKDIDNNIKYIINRNEVLYNENESFKKEIESQRDSIIELRRIETSLREANSSLQEEVKNSVLSMSTEKETLSNMREEISIREARIESQMATIQIARNDLLNIAREVSRIDTPQTKAIVDALMHFNKSITDAST
ncbi:TPA: hypothetical protein SLN52_003886 [Serratia marcescens]|nr:hypothetical protein [Serratia marcescens]